MAHLEATHMPTTVSTPISILNLGGFCPKLGYTSALMRFLVTLIAAFSLSLFTASARADEDVVEVDLSSWRHPTRGVLEKNRFTITSVELVDKTYPIFHVNLPSYLPRLHDKAEFEKVLAALAKANAYWDFTLVDGNNVEVRVVCDRRRRLVTATRYLHEEAFQPPDDPSEVYRRTFNVLDDTLTILNVSEDLDHIRFLARFRGKERIINFRNALSVNVMKIAVDASGRAYFLLSLLMPSANGCHELYQRLDVGTNGLVVSNTFGQCDVFKGVRSKGDSVVLEMDKYNADPDAPSQGTYEIILFKGKLVSPG
jgi:hypothetical protein